MNNVEVCSIGIRTIFPYYSTICVHEINHFECYKLGKRLRGAAVR